ncbi:hypothetical protein BGZ93_002943 [Podila epicladia]|nr:hypothetical protein BGZ92_003624 [Podila epicladia]KAG0097343.1 hypothetical protein BGZ93_002943 [Podila epicladia]
MSERKFSAEEIVHHEGLFKHTLSGINNWNYTLTPTHPRPLIIRYGLIPGAFDVGGLDSMVVSAGQPSVFVNKALAATNTTKVDLFGNSQGTLMPRYYLKYLVKKVGNVTHHQRMLGYKN